MEHAYPDTIEYSIAARWRLNRLPLRITEPLAGLLNRIPRLPCLWYCMVRVQGRRVLVVLVGEGYVSCDGWLGVFWKMTGVVGRHGEAWLRVPRPFRRAQWDERPRKHLRRRTTCRGATCGDAVNKEAVRVALKTSSPSTLNTQGGREVQVIRIMLKTRKSASCPANSHPHLSPPRHHLPRFCMFGACLASSLEGEGLVSPLDVGHGGTIWQSQRVVQLRVRLVRRCTPRQAGKDQHSWDRPRKKPSIPHLLGGFPLMKMLKNLFPLQLRTDQIEEHFWMHLKRPLAAQSYQRPSSLQTGFFFFGGSRISSAGAKSIRCILGRAEEV